MNQEDFISKEERIKIAIENRLTQSIIILRDLLENKGRIEYIADEVIRNTNDFSEEIVFVCALKNLNSLKSFEKEILLDAFRDYIKDRRDDIEFVQRIEKFKENIICIVKSNNNDPSCLERIQAEQQAEQQLEKMDELFKGRMKGIKR